MWMNSNNKWCATLRGESAKVGRTSKVRQVNILRQNKFKQPVHVLFLTQYAT